jgi:hypothetical protein
LASELEKIEQIRVKEKQDKLSVQLNADFENIRLTKVDEVDDDVIFSTVDMQSAEQSKNQTPKLPLSPRISS